MSNFFFLYSPINRYDDMADCKLTKKSIIQKIDKPKTAHSFSTKKIETMTEYTTMVIIENENTIT